MPNYSDRVRCRDFVLEGLLREASNRDTSQGFAWIDRERLAVANAANAWAQAHGYIRRVTVDDVERVETLALGHVDYASKLALHVAAFITSDPDA